LDVVDLSTSDTVQHALGLLLVLLGAASAVLAWVRWAMAERSMRSGQPLPSFGIGATFTLGVLGACAVLIVVLD
jgi:putative membrane protein